MREKRLVKNLEMLKEEMMKILIVGAGGREHAIAWKLSQNEKVEKIFIAPGNACVEMLPNAESVNLGSIDEYISFAKDNNVELTVVGSEELLVQGIVDEFHKNGLKILRMKLMN